MKHISKFLILVFTFIYIYTPPLCIWPTQIDVLIYIVFAFLIVAYKCNPWSALKVGGIKTSFNIMLVLLLFSICWTLANPPSIGITDLNPVRILRLIIEVLFFPFILVSVCQNEGITQRRMIYGLIYLAIFQAYISVLMIFIPPIKDFVTTYIIQFGENNKLTAETLFTSRVWGIGSEYLFALPIFQAMMTCVYISFHEKKNILFYFNLFCLIASAIFCARTSIFVLLGYFIYYSAKNIKKHFITTLLLIIFIPVVIWYAFKNLLSIDDIVAINQFNRAFNGEYQGYDSLFDSMLFFPNDISTWIIGNGTYAFFAQRNSDLGYVNDIFFGGLVYLLLEILSLYPLYKRTGRANVLSNVMPFLFLILLVLHYKGSIYLANDFMKGLFLLYYIAFFNLNKPITTPKKSIQF